MKLAMQALLTILLAGVALSSPVSSSAGEVTTWEQYKQAFNKQYASLEEEAVRKQNFLRTLQEIEQNQEKHGAVLGLNHFSDWSEEEFEALTMPAHSAKQVASIFNASKEHQFELPEQYYSLPENFDWRERTTLNPAEQQGQCGSCWSFGTTFTVEAAYAIKHNTHVKLSKQEMVDCTLSSYDRHYRNLGCSGGYPQDAYRYVVEHGLHESSAYPYTGSPNERCYTPRLGSNYRRYTISNYGQLAFNVDDATLQSVIHNTGPVAVMIHGTSPTFRNYRSGIMRNVLPHTTNVNHVVSLVGWGSQNGIDYWVLRNSWGTGWGQNGYAYIARHNCLIGMNNWVTYPILH